jgi:hypothetical protein
MIAPINAILYCLVLRTSIVYHTSTPRMINNSFRDNTWVLEIIFFLLPSSKSKSVYKILGEDWCYLKIAYLPPSKAILPYNDCTFESRKNNLKTIKTKWIISRSAFIVRQISNAKSVNILRWREDGVSFIFYSIVINMVFLFLIVMFS